MTRDDDDLDGDGEIKKRAAWLLGMLALVAALVVTVMVTFFNGSGGSGGDGTVDDVAGPTPLSSDTQDATSGTPTPRSTTASTTPGGTRASTPVTTPSTPTTPTTSASGSTTSPPGSGRGSCPTDARCALDTDIGNAVDAINAYRSANGKAAVPGSVSEAAKKCALTDGSDCPDTFAESQVPSSGGRVSGAAAVQKIEQFGKLLDPMKAIEVGWAYDPGSKQYWFAIVRRV